MARRKKVAAGSTGLGTEEVAQGTQPEEVRALAAQVSADGGAVLSGYRDPFGGKWVLFAVLPLEKVAPTPYQRELSDTHARRLTDVIGKVGRFLDPLIAVRHGGSYWTPNGMHRLEALKRLGAKTVTVLLLPEPEVAFRILALNTEKAHNLRDKSLEVIRMARGLAADAQAAKRAEADWAFEFEEPAYLTIGLCYEQNGRFSGSVYQPVARRCDEFSAQPIGKSLAAREKTAAQLLALDEAVIECVKKLKEAGLQSPYLKAFVVARANPLRWIKAPKPGEKAPRAEYEPTLKKMLDAVRKLDPAKIKPNDIAASGGPPVAEEG